jgi:WD40 repeat protein
MVTQLLQLPDGRLISSGADGVIKVWNINTRKCIQSIEAHTTKICDIIMLKDGNVASCSSDNSIKIWNMKDYTCIKEIKNTFNDKEILKQMLLLKDGRVAVVCNNKSETSVIRLLDTKEFTMNEEISFGEEGYVIKQIQQMEDGRLIATGEKLMGLQMEKIGKVFDVDKKEMLFKLNETVEKPGMFIVLNNGKILIENDKEVVENEKKVLYKEFNILG